MLELFINALHNSLNTFLNAPQLPFITMQVDFESLKRDVGYLEHDRASDFFFKTIDSLVAPLGYTLHNEFYLAIGYDRKPLRAVKKQDLDELGKNNVFTDYIKTQEFINSSNLITARVHFQDLHSLDMGVYEEGANSIESTALLGLDNSVVTGEVLNQLLRESKTRKYPLTFAFEHDYIVELVNDLKKFYFLHPRHLLKAVENTLRASSVRV
jgi:hypothetical protein